MTKPELVRKPRERKTLAQRIQELKDAKQGHLSRAEAVEGKLRGLLSAEQAKADEIAAAVRAAAESE